jgi:hypothetical protein
MIWAIRALIFLVTVGPFVGAFWPASGLEQEPAYAVFGSPEAQLILQAVGRSLVNTLYAAGFCLILFSAALCRRSAAGHVSGLVLVITLTFFVPVALKASAFLSLSDDVFGLAGGSILFAAWNLTYGAIFLWAACLGFVSSDRHAAVVESISELARGVRRIRLLLRAMALPLCIGALCTFATIFFAGREMRILTLDATPVGETISELFGGRDGEAAVIGLALYLVLLCCVVGLWFLASPGRAKNRLELGVAQGSVRSG